MYQSMAKVSIYKRISDALATLELPYQEQGTMNKDTLPATFLTYQLLYKGDVSHADNLPTASSALVQIALYSTDPSIKQSAEGTISEVMFTAGFTRAGGRDLPYDGDTGHYGYACDFRYHEAEEEE